MTSQCDTGPKRLFPIGPKKAFGPTVDRSNSTKYVSVEAHYKVTNKLPIAMPCQSFLSCSESLRFAPVVDAVPSLPITTSFLSNGVFLLHRRLLPQ